MAVPGNITSQLSKGTNGLIRSGAYPVTCAEDVLQILGVPMDSSTGNLLMGENADEHAILKLLQAGISDSDELLLKSKLPVNTFNRTLTMLEIGGRIRPQGGGQWTL